MEKNSIDKVKDENKKINTDTLEIYKNNTKIHGNSIHTIDFNSSPKIIKISNKGSLGNSMIYFVINNDKVDVYNGTDDNSSFTVSKNIPLSETEISSITSKGSLNGNKNNYKIINEEEKKENKNLIKISYTNNHSGIEKDLSSSGINIDQIEKNKELKNTISNLKKGTTDYYWVDKKTFRLVKCELDTTEMNKLFYYMNNKNGTNPPIKSSMISNISYDKIEKIKIPTNISYN